MASVAREWIRSPWGGSPNNGWAPFGPESTQRPKGSSRDPRVDKNDPVESGV